MADFLEQYGNSSADELYLINRKIGSGWVMKRWQGFRNTDSHCH